MNPMFYFLLALTAVLATTANAGPVLDVNGDIIFGGSYYVLPLIWGPTGGGLTLTPRNGNQCPLFVGLERSEVNRGIPVKFSNWMSRVGFVPESENLNIKMDVEPTICAKSTYWWVTTAPSHWRSSFIAVGPKPEAGGEDSSRSFFQIKKTRANLNAYKFVFCRDGNDCTDVGKNEEGGVRGLVIGSTPPFGNPFEIVFVKATETESSPKIMSII
ncbi:kunitz trypsin inhibitor 1 [Raphanus sativus]|uniref:Kunitz trypsin inhibitor 4 n=1 Tax=Raphanus sativus TaxID=3726 RepID=A0A6J0LB73_RAPSA|nr:kunitz trypsin inhibitor 4 [Raphanus sativus]KAJ4875018.1 kunitz trypsin inhibitor 1 [Raphanus sativus]